MKAHRILLGGILLGLLSGCPIDGDDGHGINCWDVNENGVNDESEDINNDGYWTTDDCTDSQSLTQTTDVEHNHQHFCEAFANLGQYPTGCPSATYSSPSGTLTKMHSSLFFQDTSTTVTTCDYSPNNGLLSIELQHGSYYWVLEGAYIANKSLISSIEELANDTCFNNCDSDSNCIASYSQINSNSNNEANDCYRFYHSDTIDQWDFYCGSSVSQCMQGLGASQIWGAMCP